MSVQYELCELCNLKYENKMIIDKKYSDFVQCYDCLFSMNFNDLPILNGSMGINLQQYIDISKKYHGTINEIPCNRLTDAGGCYVCMTLLDIPFENPIKNNNKEIEKTESHKEFEAHNISICDNINSISNIMILL
jgi:hypothetical protein